MPRPDARPARLFAWMYGAVLGLAALVAALALPAEGLDGSTGHFWWVALASLAIAGSLVARAGLWTTTGAYAGVFWCFHFGMIAVVGAGLVAPIELSLWDQLWLMGPYGGDAAVLALIGFASFAAGAALLNAWRGNERPAAASVAPGAAHQYGSVGSIIVLVAIATWAGIVVSVSGFEGFSASYAEYLNATAEAGGALGLIWLALGCGLVISVSGAPGRLRTAAFVGFGALAMIALPLGLRGEIMFPTVAAVVAAARCGWTPSPRRAAAFVAVLLVTIPVVKEVRQTGLQGVPTLVVDLRVFDALLEMGGSLHPVEKVMRWRAEGEALEMGASYWAPFERALARVVPGLRTAAAEDDMRIMNVLVMDRIGAIGFSPVAEAYRNFGAIGVVLVLGLIGAGLSALDRIADRRAAVLAMAAVYVPLLVNVRNSFVSVPLQVALGLLLVAGLGVVRHMSSFLLGRAYARPPYIGSQV